MTVPSLSLDHFGAMVRDLDAGAERWRKLGFQLAPRSPQMGAVPGAVDMKPWATANHCVILRRGYLELIGVHDPAKYNPWQSRMDRFEGIHIAALRCDDADSAFDAISKTMDGFEPPVDRRREAPYGDGTRIMKFRNIFSRDDVWPEGRMIIIEHQTPEILWQEPLMTHPNGATGLRALILCTDDPMSLSERITAVVGSTASGRTPGEWGFKLPDGAAITVMTPQRFRVRFPGAALPTLPCIAGAALDVEGLENTRRTVCESGIDCHENADGFWVGPDDANGAVLQFVEE